MLEAVRIGEGDEPRRARNASRDCAKALQGLGYPIDFDWLHALSVVSAAMPETAGEIAVDALVCCARPAPPGSTCAIGSPRPMSRSESTGPAPFLRSGGAPTADVLAAGHARSSEIRSMTTGDRIRHFG